MIRAWLAANGTPSIDIGRLATWSFSASRLSPRDSRPLLLSRAMDDIVRHSDALAESLALSRNIRGCWVEIPKVG